MKKVIFTLALLIISVLSFAQPNPGKNGNGSEVSKESPITTNVQITAASYTYGETLENVGIVINVSELTYTTTYKLNGSSNAWSETVPTEVGSYDVNVVTVATASWTSITETLENALVINQATPEVTITATSYTYNETAETVSILVTPNGCTYTAFYKLNGSSDDWSETVPTDAGSYDVKVITIATTNCTSATRTSENALVISQALGDITWYNPGTTINKGVDEDDFTLDLATSTSGNITYTSDNSDVATVDVSTGKVSIINSGTAVITATSTASNENYTTVNKTLTIVVSTVTANEEISLKSNIYPNPITLNSSFLFELNIFPTNGKLEIYDTSGKCMMMKHIDSKSTLINTSEIDVVGLYVLKYSESNAVVFTEKIIIE